MNQSLNYQHKELAAGRWREFSFFKQMGNIGSEVSRALSWREKDPTTARNSVNGALELLDLTLEDPKNQTRRSRAKELWLIREAIVDFFYFDNQYGSSPETWREYFDAFAYAAALERGY